MSSVVAVVKSIIGQVIAVSPEGVQRVLVEGDRIYQGDQLLTGAAGAVTLDVGNGKLVDLGRDSQWSSADLPQAEAPRATTQANDVPSTEDLQKAIAAGLDPTQALAPTAAGPSAAPSAAGNGGVGGGHSFVVLDATAGRVDPTIGYDTAGLGNGGDASDERQGELPPNLAPEFSEGSNGVLNLTTAEDTLLTGAFAARDPNGDTISYSVGQAPANGLLVLNPNGTWQYNPNGDYNGADSFSVIVTDARGATSTLVVNVGITPVNDAPVATGTYTSSVTDTAANDSFADIKGQLTATDVDDTNLTWSGSAKGAYGELTVNADGSYTYVVDANAVNALPLGQNPSESFTVTVTDPSGATDTRVITINVQGANDTPVAQDGQASGNEDSVIGGQLVATDRDTGSTLTFTTNGNPPAGFTLKPDGSWTFDGKDPAYQHLAEGETLVVQVPYTVTDEHGATSTATLTVTLTGTNDAPVALPGAATTEENTVLNGQVPAASDVDGNVTGYQLTTGVGANNGTLTFNPDGSYSFNPGKDFDALADGQSRDVTFTYQAKDNNGALSDPQTITITVTGTNDAPVALPGAATTEENTVLNGQVPAASDVDGSIAGYQLVGDVGKGNGSLTFNADGSYVFNPGKDFDSLADGQSRDVTFTYQAKDNNGALSDPQTITITVTGTNDAAVIAGQTSGSTDETDAPVSLNGKLTISDVDSPASFQAQANTAGTYGKFSVAADGTWNYVADSAYNELKVGEHLTDSFTVLAADGTSTTVTVTINGTNDAPVATATSGAVKEDAQISGQLAATDADNGAQLSYTLDKTAPAGFSVDANGKWTFDASVSEYQHLKAGATQVISVPFTVTDEHGATSSSTLTITITGTNDAPVADAISANASEDELSIGKLTATDVDDGAKLSFSLNDKAPAGFTLAKNGSWLFNGLDPAYQSLAAGETKVLSIDYTVTDEHGATSTNTLTLTVTGTNDTPIALPSLTFVREDAQISGELKAIDVDNGAQLTFSLNKAAPAGLILGSDGKWSFDASDAAYQHLKAGAVQIINVPYTVTDEHGASTQSVLVITVTGTNDAPRADAATAAATEDAVSKGQLTATDVDDGAKLSFSVSGNPPAGFTLKTDGSWTFDGKNPAYQSLAEGETRDIQVKYIVTDEHGATDTQTLTLTVTGTNDAPVAYADTVTTEENTVLNGQVPAATDVDGTIASYQLTTDVAQGKGSLTFNSDGSYSFNPGTNFDHLADGESDTVTFTYQAKDNNGALSDPQTITITVTGSNDAPVASATSGAVKEDAQISGQLAATDADNGAQLSYTLDKTAPAGFSVDANGKWTFDASASEYQHLKAGATQVISVPFTVTDEHGATSSSTLTITITGTNDAPVADAISANASEDKLSIGKLTATDVDDGAKLSFSLNDKAPAGFTLAKNGSWLFNGLDPAYQSLAAGETKVLSIDYTVTDEHGATITNTLTLTVTGTNDTPIALPSLTFVREDAQISGELKAIDVDNGAQLTFSLNKAAPAGLTLGSDGKWSFDASDAAYQHLKAGAVQIINVPYTVTDEHGASTQSVLVITVTGTNDAPRADAATAAATEDAVSKGQLTATDVDDGAKLSFSVSGNPPAGFTLKTDGSWTFDGKNPAYQSLAEGETKDIQVKYIVTDEHGATDTQTLTITVTGTNDPAVIGGVATVDVNETDAPITTGGQLTVSDVDGAASFQAQSNVSGKYGTFSLGTDGAWTYTASDAYNELKQGEKLTDSFTVKAADGTSATVTVNIVGTNDAPVAYGDTKATGENATFSSQVPVATDIDGTVVSYQLASNVGTGNGSLTFNNDGSYSFNPGNDFDSLAQGETRDVSFTYQAKDNNGALSDPQTITITVTGTNDAPVAGPAEGTVHEDNWIGGSLPGSDVDHGAQLTYSTTGPLPAGFGSDSSGRWGFDANNPAYQHLAEGDTQTFTVNYSVTDQYGAKSSSTLTITVIGTNDAPQAQAASASVNEDNLSSGTLTATDVDDGHTLAFSLKDAAPGGFTLNQDGTWSFDGNHADYQQLGAGETLELQIKFIVTDEHGATDESVLTLTVTGNNDAAIISGAKIVNVNETDAPITTGGQLSVSDVDGPETFQAQTNVVGKYGTFNLGTDGAWTYVAKDAYNELKPGETLTDTFTVKAADGTSSSVTVNILGTNDAPTAYDDSVSVDENGRVNGKVPAGTDPDGRVASYQLVTDVGQGQGALNFNSSGTYHFNPGSDFDHLAAGESATVTFTYQAKDNNGALSEPKTITITVTGSNDAAVISGVKSSSVNETDAPISTGGKLTVSDVDSPETFQAQTDVAGKYGTFNLGTDGTWTYVAKDAYNELKVGQSYTDTFTVKSADGTSATVTVNIIGTNDRPVAFSDSQSTEENTVLHGQVPVATDIDGTIVRYEVVKDVAQGKGTLTFNDDGSYTFNPGTAFDHLAAGQSETVTFTYQAKDNNGAVSDQQTITITVTGSNDAAVITGQASGSANETDAPVTIGGKLDISDVDSPASFQAQTNSAGDYGKFSIGANGAWTYVADSAYNELKQGEKLTDSFTVKAADGTSATVTVTIVGTNDKPVAFADTASTGENTVLDGHVPASTDVDGTIASYQLATNVAAGKGTLTFNADGSYRFNPGTAFDHLAQGQSENVTFTYQAKDNNGALSDPQTVTITVTGTNDKPVAYADTQTTEENTVLQGQVPVATDIDGTIASYQLATDVAQGKGTLTFNADGSYTFTPGTAFDHLAAGQSENVTFTYQAKDNNGALSDPQTITITVTGTNDAPVAVPDTAHTNEDTAIRIDVLGNDTDAEHDALIVTGASAGNGTVVINQDGSLSYTPKENFSGSDTITYSISDGKGGTSTSTVTVSIEAVADKPSLSLDGSSSHPKATGLTVDTWTGLALGNGGNGAAPADLQAKIDAAGTPTTHGSTNSVSNTDVTAGTATKVSGLIFLEAGHTYTFTGVGDDSVRLVIGGSTVAQATWGGTGGTSGQFSGTFTPTESGYYPIALYQHNQSGPGNYTLSISDNGSSAQVLGTGSALVYHNAGELTSGGERLSDLTGSSGQTHYKVFGLNEGNEDTAINLSKIKAALVDTDGSETLSVSIGKIPVGATLSDGKNSFTADATHNSVDLKGWNLDTLTLTPPADFNGTIKLEVSATATESSNNDAATRTVDLNVTVYPVNDAPTVSGAQNLTTDEDTPVSGQIHASDVDGDSLGYAVKSGSGPAHGSVTFGSDGQYTYTPAKDYNGSDSFTVVVSDGKGGSVEQVVKVGINPVNDVPTTSDQSKTVAEDSPLTGKIAASDVDGDTLSYAVKSGVAHGQLVLNTATGDYTYTPAANYNGPDSFTITVSDGKGGSVDSVVRITVTPVNDAPVFNAPSNTTTPEDTPLTGKVSATDVDGDSLTYSLKSGPSHGSIVVDAAGNYTYTPSKDYNGGDSFTVTVNDGHGGVVDQVVSLTITPVNDAPTTGNQTKTVDEDSPLSGKIIASDVDGDTLSYAVKSGVAHGQLVLNTATGDYTYTPAANYNGPDSFTITVSDGKGGSVDSVVSITVNPVNDAPTTADQSKTTAEDTAVTGKIIASDVDGDTLSYTLKAGSAPAHGTVTLNAATGDYTYTPAKDYNGSDSFTVVVSDGKGGTVNSVVNLNVTPVNDAPEAKSDSKSTGENSTLNGQVPTATDVDSAVNPNGYTLVQGVGSGNGSLTFNANGSYVFNPGTDFDSLAPGESRQVTFTYTAKDAEGAVSAPATVTITVNGANDAPNGADKTITLDEDSSRSFSASDFGFSDVDHNDALSAVRIDSLPTNGSLKLNGNAVTAGQVIDAADLGKLVFTPAANGNGSNYANFTFSVKDSNGAFDATPNKVTFNVTPVNDAPVAVNDTFTVSGLTGKYWGYNEGPDGSNLTSLSQVTAFMNGHAASATFTSTTLNYNLSGGDLGGDGNLQKFLGNDAGSLNTDPANTSDAIIQLTGAINLNAGSYQLRVNADDGFSIKIDGVEVFKYDAIQSPTGRESAVFTIAQSGNHSIEIVYWDQGGQAQLQVEMRPQGGTYTTVGGTALTHAVGELVTNEDTPLTIAPQTLLGNDSDVDGDSLSIVSVQGAVNGSVKLEGGNVVFTPAKDFNGSGSFTYTISDGHGGTSTATVTVGVNAVNDAPEAKGDSKTTGENTSISGQVPTATDIDSAVDANGYALVSGPSAGTLTFNANGSYVYNPGTAFDSLNVGETRQVTFTYTAKDVQGAVSAPATVTITINGENDAPTGTDKTVSLNEDSSRTFTAADFGFADKDAGDALKAIRIDNLPTAGSLTLNGQSVTAGQVIAVSLLTSLVYTPLANAAGSTYATLKFSVQDSHDSFSSSSSTLTFAVTAVNDAPLSADGSASVYAGKTYTFGTKDFAFSDTADSANGQNHSLQNVIVKALPDSGSLLLNGTAVKAGQAISVSDISSGKLTFVPDSSGSNAHFSFAVQDSGGTANGGVDTSATYGFDIHVGQVQIPSTTPNGDNTLTGGSGDDVILGDVGGVKTLTQGGTNYNIALVIDTSGSMAYNLAGQSGAAYNDSRMKLVKDALINLANELKGHDGVVNIALIGFQSTASLKVSVSDLTSANIDKLVTAINGLSATGGTDYQAAFEQAVSWFNGQTKGYTNLTLFLTDGDPTESKTYGDGSSTSNSIVKESAQAFVALSDLSEVRAIGIGTNVNSDILKYFDNSSVTGIDSSMNWSSSSTLFTFNNGTALTGWTLSPSSTGTAAISGGELRLTDTNAAGSTTANSSDLTVGKNSTSVFSFEFSDSMRNGDTFTWKLMQNVKGVWTEVESHTLNYNASNDTYSSKSVGEGTYRFDFVLTDNTSTGTATVYLDNIKQATTTYATVGQVDIVKQASDLTAALHGGSTSTELAPSGNDTIHGGAGDDIIFGDTINTDNLPWGVNGNPAKPADMPAGSGVSALSAFLELKNGHAATSDEMYDYIKNNHTLFNVEGDTRGGSDNLYGGEGNDILYGQGGNDFLFGENGNDILIGGTGDDQLTGGKGNDILTGGAGADLFIWKAGDTGNDTITDFKAGEGDRIDISDLLPETAHNDILSYLKVDTATSTLQVSTTGQINSGGAADVTIKLSGVDLSSYGSTSTEIVNKLVAGSDPVVKTEHH
ncbi:retention module-containing protein [Pseudomonas nicosulfuronedens]|uniref:Retention module-containing protein n=1 Tax=Pseudomonas nicosulfuronedens TaxID=2571105 RepID=A0A5R9RCD7_9PSED|nr:retention module-containing protein [Pseudomonas nicosulfuronedens]TLX79722.1 retention module-containing protein [Pseudomonas nicosulfuronedens]